MRENCAFRLTITAWLLVYFALPPALFSQANLPTGGDVTAGAASFQQPNATTLNINQSTQNAIIQWQDFSIAAGHTTNFNQPDSSSFTLNRVVTGNPSALYGTLNANGSVFLINPNGILVGPGGVINTQSFFASTFNLPDNQFLSGGALAFGGNSTASIINHGTINALGGDVVLLSRTIENHGTIKALQGGVHLGAGEQIVLAPSGNQRLTVTPRLDGLTSSITNKGLIEATKVELQAANGNAYALAINNTGLIRAQQVNKAGGRIFIGSKGNGAIQNTGRLIARGENGQNGGEVVIQGNAAVTPGQVEVDGAQGGLIKVNARGLLLAESMSATGDTESGGLIELTAETEIIETSSSRLNVSGARGGKIQLSAGQQITSSGLHRAIGYLLGGGWIEWFAPFIKLLSTKIDASGFSGGGLVRIGGEYQGGKNLAVDEIPNAKSVVASSGTEVRAETTGTDGDGGTVIFWGDDQALIKADVWARPGSQSGLGGLVEVSSFGQAQWDGKTMLTSWGDRTGRFLLDPKNIYVWEIGLTDYSFAMGFGYDSVVTPASGDALGASVSLQNNRLAVGATGDDGFGDTTSNSGAVYLFSFADADFGTPVLEGIIGKGYTGGKNYDLSTLDIDDAFGYGVSLNGNRLAVGATGDDGLANLGGTNIGAVYLFSFADAAFSTPTLQATIGKNYTGGQNINVTNSETNDEFGTSVSLDGNNLAVGAHRDWGFGNGRGTSGAVYLYGFTNSTFAGGSQLAILGNDYTGGNNVNVTLDGADRFGTSVALSGTRLVVGALNDSGLNNTASPAGRGAAYFITFANNTTFSGGAVQKVAGVNYGTAGGISMDIPGSSGAGFGRSVAISGNRVAIGSAGTNNRGVVYLLDFTDSSFGGGNVVVQLGGYGQSATKNALETLDSLDTFGSGVSLDNDRLVVGIQGDDGLNNALSNSGKVRFYNTNNPFDPATATFATSDSSTVTITGTALANLLATQDVTLQANSNIYLDANVIVSAGGNGHKLTLEAGRTIHFGLYREVTINTDNGQIVATVNQQPGTIVEAQRQAWGSDGIDFATVPSFRGQYNSNLVTGTGNVTLTIENTSTTTVTSTSYQFNNGFNQFKVNGVTPPMFDPIGSYVLTAGAATVTFNNKFLTGSSSGSGTSVGGTSGGASVGGTGGSTTTSDTATIVNQRLNDVALKSPDDLLQRNALDRPPLPTLSGETTLGSASTGQPGAVGGTTGVRGGNGRSTATPAYDQEVQRLANLKKQQDEIARNEALVAAAFARLDKQNKFQKDTLEKRTAEKEITLNTQLVAKLTGDYQIAFANTEVARGDRLVADIAVQQADARLQNATRKVEEDTAAKQALVQDLAQSKEKFDGLGQQLLLDIKATQAQEALVTALASKKNLAQKEVDQFVDQVKATGDSLVATAQAAVIKLDAQIQERKSAAASVLTKIRANQTQQVSVRKAQISTEINRIESESLSLVNSFFPKKTDVAAANEKLAAANQAVEARAKEVAALKIQEEKQKAVLAERKQEFNRTQKELATIEGVKLSDLVGQAEFAAFESKSKLRSAEDSIGQSEYQLSLRRKEKADIETKMSNNKNNIQGSEVSIREVRERIKSMEKTLQNQKDDWLSTAFDVAVWAGASYAAGDAMGGDVALQFVNSGQLDNVKASKANISKLKAELNYWERVKSTNQEELSSNQAKSTLKTAEIEGEKETLWEATKQKNVAHVPFMEANTKLLTFNSKKSSAAEASLALAQAEDDYSPIRESLHFAEKQAQKALSDQKLAQVTAQGTQLALLASSESEIPRERARKELQTLVEQAEAAQQQFPLAAEEARAIKAEVERLLALANKVREESRQDYERLSKIADPRPTPAERAAAQDLIDQNKKTLQGKSGEMQAAIDQAKAEKKANDDKVAAARAVERAAKDTLQKAQNETDAAMREINANPELVKALQNYNRGQNIPAALESAKKQGVPVSIFNEITGPLVAESMTHFFNEMRMMANTGPYSGLSRLFAAQKVQKTAQASFDTEKSNAYAVATKATEDNKVLDTAIKRREGDKLLAENFAEATLAYDKNPSVLANVTKDNVKNIANSIAELDRKRIRMQYDIDNLSKTFQPTWKMSEELKQLDIDKEGMMQRMEFLQSLVDLGEENINAQSVVSYDDTIVALENQRGPELEKVAAAQSQADQMVAQAKESAQAKFGGNVAAAQEALNQAKASLEEGQKQQAATNAQIDKERDTVRGLENGITRIEQSIRAAQLNLANQVESKAQSVAARDAAQAQESLAQRKLNRSKETLDAGEETLRASQEKLQAAEANLKSA